MDYPTRVCRTCGFTGAASDFMPGKHKSAKRCRACTLAYNQAHYLKNKAEYNTRSRVNTAKRRRALYEFLRDYFLSHPCVDCGERNPIKLQFDHVVGAKSAPVSKMVSDMRPVGLIRAEIAKCVVRCANCHMVKTATERNWYWLKILGEIPLDAAAAEGVG